MGTGGYGHTGRLLRLRDSRDSVVVEVFEGRVTLGGSVFTLGSLEPVLEDVKAEKEGRGSDKECEVAGDEVDEELVEIKSTAPCGVTDSSTLSIFTLRCTGRADFVQWSGEVGTNTVGRVCETAAFVTAVIACVWAVKSGGGEDVNRSVSATNDEVDETVFAPEPCLPVPVSAP